MPYINRTDPITGVTSAVYVTYNEDFIVGGVAYNDWADYQRQLDTLAIYNQVLSQNPIPAGERYVELDPWMTKTVYEPNVPLGGGFALPAVALPSPSPVFSPPVPQPVPSSPRDTVLNAEIIEGFRLKDGDPSIFSAGRRPFARIEGWLEAGKALVADGDSAITSNQGAAYCDTLKAKQPQVSLPEGAAICGIKVYVTRSIS